jgi:hypothetical protein
MIQAAPTEPYYNKSSLSIIRSLLRSAFVFYPIPNNHAGPAKTYKKITAFKSCCSYIALLLSYGSNNQTAPTDCSVGATCL